MLLHDISVSEQNIASKQFGLDKCYVYSSVMFWFDLGADAASTEPV